SDDKRHPVSGSLRPENRRSKDERDALLAEEAPHFLRDVGVLTPQQLPPVLDNCDSAAEAAECLRQFYTDVAASKHHQMLGQIIQVERLHMRQGLRFR